MKVHEQKIYTKQSSPITQDPVEHTGFHVLCNLNNNSII